MKSNSNKPNAKLNSTKKEKKYQKQQPCNGKKLFQQYGLSVPSSIVATSIPQYALQSAINHIVRILSYSNRVWCIWVVLIKIC